MRLSLVNSGFFAAGCSTASSVTPENPVAIIVMEISSVIDSSTVVPKMMFAEESITPCTRLAASLTSVSVMSLPPEIFRITPFAPSIVVSSSGLETAWRTASMTRRSPFARPSPM